MSPSELSTTRVMSAIYECKGRLGRWATSAEIASYLEVPVKDVRPLLAELRVKRLFRDRQRDNRKVWMPWGAP